MSLSPEQIAEIERSVNRWEASKVRSDHALSIISSDAYFDKQMRCGSEKALRSFGIHPDQEKEKDGAGN